MIREADTDDIPFLAPIERAGDALFVEAGHPEFAGAATISAFEAARGVAEHRLWVYEHEGVVVGWVLVDRAGDELGVKQISVSPGLGRRGIGTALMRHVMAETTAPTIVLDTQLDVAWNAPWYRRLGFDVVPPGNWTAEMARTSEDQVAAGFDWSTRVHMRWRRPLR